jgi:RND family efflux transporter MFP subunit
VKCAPKFNDLKMIQMKKNIILIIILSAMIGVSALAQEFAPASVNVVKAEIKSLTPIVWVSGNVVSPNNSRISAEVSGRLISLADIGTTVLKGDVMAQIDDKTLLINKQQNMANVDSAKSQLKFLESEVKRNRSLAKQNLSAKTAVDQVISERDVAKANLAVAQAQLEQNIQDLADSLVKAPFDGIVTQRLSNIGEYVDRGDAIILLVETANLEASVFAPLTAYQFLKHSSTLSIESALGKGLVAIKSLVPVATSRSHLMEVRLDMSTIDWPIGLDIKAAVANGKVEDVLAIPRDALVLRRDGISVFRINKENIAEQITVLVGIGSGDHVQVIGDIKEGEQIVIRGAERLDAGQIVQIKTNNQDLISGKAINLQ